MASPVKTATSTVTLCCAGELDREKQIGMKVILLIIAMILIPSLASTDVIITIDTLSNQNDEVEFTVTNIKKHSHTKYQGVHVEKKEKGDWKTVRWHLICPCDAKCRKTVIDLGINESRKYIWDKKDSSCDVASRGAYRIKITSDWNEKANKVNTFGISREFSIP